jgi:uncharacterized membrane protein
LEAFSDGVLAIAATLLVLELHVPAAGHEPLGSALLTQWPAYAAYVVSFMTIGIIWVNHHAVLERIRVVNRPFLFLNLLFLMAVAVIPFPTALLADYLREGHDERLAAAVYGGTMTVMGVSFGVTWAYAVIGGLLRENVDPDLARRSLWTFALGNPLYLLAIGVSLLSAGLALAIYAALKAVAQASGLSAIGLRVGSYLLVGCFLLGVAYWYRAAGDAELREAK